MNAPTLIVGLGGKGSEVALRVSKMVTPEQRQNIGFVVFDTDVNELAQIRKTNPFVKTVQTSTKLTVGEYLNIDRHSRDTWFPVNSILNSKTLTEGAAQVRAISRLAFETAVRAGKLQPLHEAIEDLYKLEGNEYEQALRVIIVSSLAGGTGSGLILPVSLYIKNYLATRFRQSANITRGFFLLPEVFYGVIPSETERNNLKSNAYATIREIDAFLMKGDATLPNKYQDTVRIEFPVAGTSEFEEYNVRPLDFCFLFDAQNSDGKKLNTFDQYLEHAANCIYSQSIGPMNKRSNSSEDNTIRKLAAENGRNRYAGAGSSLLIYPYEDVREFLALNWTKECVSNQWLVFDKMYEAQLYENSLKRSQGISAKDIDPVETYITSVEQLAKDKDPFARAVIESCARYDETGTTKISDNWDEFIGALLNKVEMDNSDGQEDLDTARDQVRNLMSSLTKGNSEEVWSSYAEVFHALETYRNMVAKNVDRSADTIAYAIFKAPSSNVTKEGHSHQIETYMRRPTDKTFIHPNAVRYFLYKTLKELEAVNVSLQNDNQELCEFFDSFAESAFDNKKTQDVIETENDLKQTKHGNMFRMSGDQEELRRKYNQYLTNVNEYRYKSIQEVVVQQGIDYVRNMVEAFENFFKSFKSKIKETEKQIKVISNKYQYIKGTAKRFVCASSVCLNGMLKECPYTGSFINIDGALSEDIYTRIREYAMLTSKPETSEYFDDIYYDGIVGYFKNSVASIYGSTVDMDIISAIEKEGEFEKGLYNQDQLTEYTKDVFNESKILAAPFIEKPLGEEKQPIHACAYNDKLNPKDDSPKSQLILSELKSFGGEEDGDIPKNMIFFYKSFYGLRANDLSKFAPKQVSETYSRSNGEYYSAYFKLISKIYPEPHKSKVITPHIDRWWHNITIFPDLDEGNGERQEYNIYAAFFWGILHGYIKLIDEGNNHNVYRLNTDDLDMTDVDDVLVVSNSTPCDTLYEVIDALGIYPELVNKILADVERIKEEDVRSSNNTMSQTMLMEDLETFRIREYPLENGNVRSIFDIPILIKKSVPSTQYFEEKVIKMLEVELEEIVKYIDCICDDDVVSEVFGEIVMKQFELYLNFIEEESKKSSKIYHDYLFTRTCTIVAKSLEKNKQKDRAAEVRKTLKKLSN